MTRAIVDDAARESGQTVPIGDVRQLAKEWLVMRTRFGSDKVRDVSMDEYPKYCLTLGNASHTLKLPFPENADDTVGIPDSTTVRFSPMNAAPKDIMVRDLIDDLQERDRQ